MEEEEGPGFRREAEVPQRRSFLFPILILYLIWLLGVPLIGVVLIGMWFVTLQIAEEKGILDRWDATRVLGGILMVRTKRGKGVLEFISRTKRFWRFYGELSIWLCFFVMFGVILVLFLSAIATAINPPDEVLPASDLLLIPGVTSFVPFKWPALALIIAILIHEYSHGIQARAHGMRLRSFGLLLLGPLPLGAFAEPEESEMERIPRRERMRLFSAGPSINLFATYIVLIMLSSVASGMVAENEGVHARGIIRDQGAEQAGILPYETITHINGNRILDYDDFSNEMSSLGSGEVASFTILSSPNISNAAEERIERTVLVTLGDHYEYIINQCDGDQECIENWVEILEIMDIQKGDAFLGVSDLKSSTGGVDKYSRITEGVYVGDEYSVASTIIVALLEPIIMIFTPVELGGHTMLEHERAMLVAGDAGIASILGTDLMLDLFDFLFWLVWINFLLGFANLIPMIPFDGGHMFRDATHSILTRLRSKWHPMEVELLANRVSSMSSIFILLILLVPVVIPRLL